MFFVSCVILTTARRKNLSMWLANSQRGILAFPLRVSDLKVHSVQDDRLFYSFYKFGGSLGTTLAVDACRHDATGIASTLAAGEESANGDVL